MSGEGHLSAPRWPRRAKLSISEQPPIGSKPTDRPLVDLPGIGVVPDPARMVEDDDMGGAIDG